MARRTAVVLAAALVVTLAVAALNLAAAPRLLWSWSQAGTWLLPLVAAAAILDSINPCAFSVLLLTVAFLLSIGNLRTRVLSVGAAYIGGLFLTYLAIGLGLLGTLHLFSTPHFMGRLGAALLVALGASNVLSESFPAFPVKLRIPVAAHRRMATLVEAASLPTAFLLGGLVGVCEFPCTGGPYLMVLGLLHDRATYLTGLEYLLLYNLIFIVPLVVLLFLASDPRLTAVVERWQKSERRAMRLVSGLAMVAFGLLILMI